MLQKQNNEVTDLIMANFGENNIENIEQAIEEREFPKKTLVMVKRYKPSKPTVTKENREACAKAIIR